MMNLTKYAANQLGSLSIDNKYGQVYIPPVPRYDL